jgi:hypothetical protein
MEMVRHQRTAVGTRNGDKQGAAAAIDGPKMLPEGLDSRVRDRHLRLLLVLRSVRTTFYGDTDSHVERRL